MSGRHEILREHALAIWRAAVAAAEPTRLVREALLRPTLAAALKGAERVLVVGAGKAGAAMAAAAETALQELRGSLAGVTGALNVPAETVRPLQAVRLQAARPAGTNHPTAEGVAGSEEILRLLAGAGPGDLALCLLSGGGSALLPAPVAGVPLADKQAVTRLLHACGATINEMNTVRKHLSRTKGGRLAQAFPGRHLVSLSISDVIGDPLDVIASGPTAPDPTTFADALAVLARFGLRERTPASVLSYLERGAAGLEAETAKALPAAVENQVIGNNAAALTAAQGVAERLGYPVLNLGSFIEGETQPVAIALAGLVRSTRADGRPARAPLCLLSGGETTVTLSHGHGRGGRNQEFVLAAAVHLGAEGLRDAVVLSGGTDGEDGPTDAAGAVADATTFARAIRLDLRPADFLRRHDAYAFFDAVGGLIRTGLTQTNVMDVRLFLLG